MMLLQTWCGVSDMGVEDMVNENLSAMQFCGLELEDDVPDHSTLGRFRKELKENRQVGKESKEITLRIQASRCG